MNMMDWVQLIGILIIIGIAMWAIYKMGYITGQHRNRMTVLNVIANLKYEQVKQLSVFEAQSLLLDRLKEAWDKSDVEAGYRR